MPSGQRHFEVVHKLCGRGKEGLGVGVPWGELFPRLRHINRRLCLPKKPSRADLPTLEELMRRRGIIKGPDFDDYQAYIEEREKELKPDLLGFNQIFPRGSMHLALGRRQSTKDFWRREDKR